MEETGADHSDEHEAIDPAMHAVGISAGHGRGP